MQAGGEDGTETGIPCDICGLHFPSRNALFKHLRDPEGQCRTAPDESSSSPSTSSVPAPPPPPPPPSEDRRAAKADAKRRARELKHRRPPKTGGTARHADATNSLWVGDLPVPWTRMGGKYRRLNAMLFAHNPRGVPQPWVKTVVRKAYRRRSTAEREGGEYLGYAIVVYRDEEEALAVLEALDGLEVSAESVFRRDQQGGKKKNDNSDLVDVGPFRLKVRRVEKSDTSSARLPEEWRREDGNNGQDEVTNLSPAMDPPLTEQLRPLSKEELLRRAGILAQTGTPQCDFAVDEEKSFPEQHNQALERVVALYKARGTRHEVHKEGRLVPPEILTRLLAILESLRWPAQNQRQGLSADRYLVLQTNDKNDCFYGDLRGACAELMKWADPEYYYSGVAVTKNFVASPHIDDRDNSYQYALSLGGFKQGGELCVEGGSDGDFVNVVNTNGRIAKVDGRHVHWVRTFNGGNRYSLIFYDTSDRSPTPVVETGVP